MRPFTRVEFATLDSAEAEARLRAGGIPSRIALPTGDDASARFAFSATADADADMALGSYSVHGGWSVTSERDVFIVATAPRRGARWETQDARGTIGSSAVLFAPGVSTVHVDAWMEVLDVSFTRRALEAAAAAHYDVEHVGLASGFRELPDRRRADLWTEAFRYSRNLLDAGLLQDGMLLAALKRNLAVTLLETFSPVTERRGWRLAPGTERRRHAAAKAFIEDHAGDPITVDDVARAVGAPFALLDRAFVLQSGTSVEEHLRRTRLDRARSELVRAAPRRCVAQRIARRWGFPSLGRFLDLHALVHPGRSLRFED